MAVGLGVEQTVLLKLGGTVIACAIAWWLSRREYRRFPRLAAVAWLPAALGLFGAATNLHALW